MDTHYYNPEMEIALMRMEVMVSMEQELNQLQYPTSPIPYHHQVPHLAYQQHHLLPELIQPVPLPWPDYLLSLYPVIGGNYSPDLFSLTGLDTGVDKWCDQSE